MQVTLAMQRYAAEIYRLQQESTAVSLTQLGVKAGASAQAVAMMVKRLRKGGYLEHELYRGVQLTPSGVKLAMPAIRRHRISEVYLIKGLGYNWAEAHELAEVFEKGLNEELEDRIFELAGRPTRCPHGEPIPSKDGVMPQINDQALILVPSGSTCIISRVRTEDPEKLLYLAELGLIPGTPFTLLSCAPFQGPLRLQLTSHDHVIGYELAKSLWVEVTTIGSGNKISPLKK